MESEPDIVGSGPQGTRFPSPFGVMESEPNKCIADAKVAIRFPSPFGVMESEPLPFETTVVRAFQTPKSEGGKTDPTQSKMTPNKTL